MANAEIPGAEVLGYGFNILGLMDDSSKTQKIFIDQPLTGSYLDKPNQITYAVPANMDVSALPAGTGHSDTFESEEDYVSWFNEQVDLKVSGWSAEMNFSLDYSQAITSKTAYSFAQYTMDYSTWEINFSDLSQSYLKPDFLSVVAALPASYGTATRQSFFTFFDTYGTHYVKQVNVGGMLLYCVSVNRSEYSDETEIKANVEIEYNAVFGVSANSQTDWDELTSNWSNNRSVTIAAKGGDSSVISALLPPTFGVNDNSAFTEWSDALSLNPDITRYLPAAIYELFDGTVRGNLQQATNDYLNSRITVEISADSGFTITTLISGKEVPNSSAPPMQNPASPFVRITLIDPDDLSVIYDASYLAVDMYFWDTVWSDINSHLSGLSAYIVALGVAGADLSAIPNSNITSWLIGCGATLSSWRSAYQPSAQGMQANTYYTCVAPVGSPQGTANESFFTQPAIPITQPPYPSPAFPATIQSDWFIYPDLNVWAPAT